MWQHCDCIGADLKALPEHFLCELCRLARADPFWCRVGPPPLPPMKLMPVQPQRSASEEDVVHVADRHFNMARFALDSMRGHHGKYQLQVCAC